MNSTQLILCAIVSGRWLTMGDQGVIYHRSRRRALRAQGQGQRWVVSPKGRVARRPRRDTLDLANLIQPPMIWDPYAHRYGNTGGGPA